MFPNYRNLSHWVTNRSPILYSAAFWALLACVSEKVIAQRDLQVIPEPDPVAELAAMDVHPLATTNLFAADPQIRKPIQMNFDSSGGLWIASSEVYPQIRPGEVANDKIIVLRDTTGDGVANSSIVFADGLLIPTGILPDGPHAAYVADSTRLLYLVDTDLDGRADKQEIVLSGFGTEDTHHLVHTLRWGPEGCVYFNQSIYIHSHIDTPDGTRRLDGGGIWRYRPSTHRLDVFCKGFINPWGHQFNEFGESFVTDGAFFEGINYAFPDSVFVTSPGATRWISGLNPGSPKHCGLEILSGDHIPDSWRGSLVTSDFRSHRVCRFEVKPSGSSYMSRQQPELITTSHVAFRPIDARMGPDGALYVADWYNPIIQHGEVDFRDDRRDRKHGRIWRVAFNDRPLDPWPSFDDLDAAQLVELLEDSSLPVRQFARQQLWKVANQDPGPVMEAMRSWTSQNLEARLLELLWMNESLDRPNQADLNAAIAEFDSLSSQSRRTVLRSLWRHRTSFQLADELAASIEQLALAKTRDDNASVRLEAVVCVGQMTGSEAMLATVAANRFPVDGPMDFAIWQSIRQIEKTFQIQNSSSDSLLAKIDWTKNPDGLATAIKAIRSNQAALAGLEVLPMLTDSIEDRSMLIDAIAASSDARAMTQLLAFLLGSDETRVSPSTIRPLIERTKADGTKPANAAGIVLKFLAARSDASRDDDLIKSIAMMTEAWKLSELEPFVQDALARTEGGLKSDLVSSLGAIDTPTAKQTIRRLAESENRELRFAAIKSLASTRPFEAVKPTLDLLGRGAVSNQFRELFGRLLRRNGLKKKIATELSTMRLETDDARELVRIVKASGGDEAIEKAIQNAGSLADASWKWSQELSDELSAKVQNEGDPARGELVYRRAELQCIACHAIGSAGGLVGPNLISIGGSAQVDYILESLIEPSAKLKEGYTTEMVLTDEGEIINGIVIGEDEKALRLRQADGKVVSVPIDSIELQKPGKSLMPAGLVDQLTESELVDLTAFLSELGRTKDYTVSTRAYVRSAQTLVYTAQANRKLNRTSVDSVAAGDPTMTWRPITATVSGSFPISEMDNFKQHRSTPPTSFLRLGVSSSENETISIKLPTEGVESWVDGKPTPIWELKSLNLKEGDHWIVLSLDRSVVQTDFTIEID